MPGSGASTGFDPADPVQNAEVLARMTLGINPGNRYGWCKGRLFAIIGPTIEAKLGEGQVTELPLRLPWTMIGDLAMTSFDVNTR